MQSISETHLSQASFDIVDQVSSNISRNIVYLLQNTYIQQTTQDIITQPRYLELSRAEQQCIKCFLDATKDTEIPPHRLARNHRRSDIGAWLLMHHLPPHPQLQVIYKQLQSKQPDLLNEPDDRILLEKMLDIHTMIQSQDRQSYIDYIHTLPREEQSRTIQIYKQMIIARMSHTNGRSIYFPYLPAEKTIDTYDLDCLHDPALQVEYPDYEVNLQRLLDAPDHILPPRSDLQELFHDIVLISSLADQLQDASLLQQVINILADETTGLIARNYPSDLFFPPHVSPQQDKQTPQKEKNIPDNYLQHSYTTLTSMRGSVHTLLQDRATLHAAFQQHGCYPSNNITNLNNIRQTLSSICETHGRVDLHYLQTNLINSNLLPFNISDNKSNLLILSSQQKSSLLNVIKHFDKLDLSNIKLTSILDSYNTDYILPITKKFLVNIYSEQKLYLLTELIQYIPSNIILFTNIDVVDRISKYYKLNSENAPSAIDENSTYILPVYKGAYLEEGTCCDPAIREKTREVIIALVYQHIKKYNPQYSQRTNNFQELSSTEFCYRVVDYLRLLRHTNTGYNLLYEHLLTTCSPVQTFTMFFKDQHAIITNTLTDEHVEGDEYR